MGGNILSDMVVGVHFAWIVFLVLGMPVLVWLNRRRLRIFHCAALAGTTLMQAMGTVCPLTYLEAWLRPAGSPDSVYPGQFIMENIEALIYLDALTLKMVEALTLILLAATALSFFFRPLAPAEPRDHYPLRRSFRRLHHTRHK